MPSMAPSGGLPAVTPHDLAPALLGRGPLAVELAEHLLHIIGEPDAFDGAYLRKTLATDCEALSRSAVFRFRHVGHDRRYHRRPCRFYPLPAWKKSYTARAVAAFTPAVLTRSS